MDLLPTMPRMRLSTADERARDLLGRLLRALLVAVGLLVVVLGVAIAPLPGPMGLPIVVLGLIIVLRNSFKARKRFVRFQHAHPRLAFPIRRLLRREPEVMPVVWQQILRMERIAAPQRWRLAKRLRRRLKRWRRSA